MDDAWVGHFPGGTANPLRPDKYSVLYETTIDAATLATPSRYAHFAEANTNLLATIARDGGGTFTKMMRKAVPGFENTIQGATKVLGKSPGKYVTWHHVPGTNRLQLNLPVSERK